MRKELTTVDPGVQAAFQELLRRHPDVDAILLSTNDGVPLLRAVRQEGGSTAGGGAADGNSSSSRSSSTGNSSTSSLPLDSLETKTAALFSIAADQARKMQQVRVQGQGQQQGGCRSIVALYQGFTLVHINLAPLVLTFAAREPPPLSASAVSTEGQGGPGGLGPLRPPTNVGMILDSQPFYEAALAPLRLAVERQEREANSLRGL